MPLPSSLRGPSPRRRWTVPCFVPGGHAQLLGAVQRRHLDRRAPDRLGDRERDLDLEVVALALEDPATRSTWVTTYRSPGGAAVASRLALAGQPDAAALAHAGGDVDPQALDGPDACRRRCRSGTGPRSPSPSRRSASTAGRSRTGPGPRTRCRGHGRPGTPWAAVPGLAPVPRQVGQGCEVGDCERDLRALDGLVEAQIETSVSRSRPGCSPRSGPAPPPPPPPWRGRTGRRGCRRTRWCRSRRRRRRRGSPGPAPPNGPAPRSYCLRFSGSPRVS